MKEERETMKDEVIIKHFPSTIIREQYVRTFSIFTQTWFFYFGVYRSLVPTTLFGLIRKFLTLLSNKSLSHTHAHIYVYYKYYGVSWVYVCFVCLFVCVYLFKLAGNESSWLTSVLWLVWLSLPRSTSLRLTRRFTSKWWALHHLRAKNVECLLRTLFQIDCVHILLDSLTWFYSFVWVSLSLYRYACVCRFGFVFVHGCLPVEESMVISFFRTVNNKSRMIWLMSRNFIEVIVIKFYRHELSNSFCWLCHPSIHCTSWKCIVVSKGVLKSYPSFWFSFLSTLLCACLCLFVRVCACTVSKYLQKCV